MTAGVPATRAFSMHRNAAGYPAVVVGHPDISLMVPQSFAACWRAGSDGVVVSARADADVVDAVPPAVDAPPVVTVVRSVVVAVEAFTVPVVVGRGAAVVMAW